MAYIFIKPIATYVPPQALLSVYVETGDRVQYTLTSDIDAGVSDINVIERLERHTRINLVLDSKYVPQYYESGSDEDDEDEKSSSKNNGVPNAVTIQLPLTVEQRDEKIIPLHLHPIFESYVAINEDESASDDAKKNAQKVIKRFTTIASDMRRYHELLSMISDASGSNVADDLVPPALQARISSVVNTSSQSLRDQSTKARADVDAGIAWFKRNLFKDTPEDEVVYEQAKFKNDSEADALTTTLFNEVLSEIATQFDNN